MTKNTKPLEDEICKYTDKELIETFDYYYERKNMLSKDEELFLTLLSKEYSKRGRKCPSCNKLYLGYPAISRKDNETEICPDCGQKEALDAWIAYKMEEDKNGK